MGVGCLLLLLTITNYNALRYSRALHRNAALWEEEAAWKQACLRASKGFRTLYYNNSKQVRNGTTVRGEYGRKAET